MKQIFFNSSQLAEVAEVDVPQCGRREVLIAVQASLISTGTETVGYGSGSLVSRGLKNTSTVKMVLNTLEREGFGATYNKIKAKKEGLTPRGYSGAGVIVKVGDEVRGYAVGDRVAYAGAPHAEYVAVGENLIARIPEGLSFSQAAFGALACISLHGVRLGSPTLGERAVVLGLGLVGLLVAQFARASGLEVICLDTNSTRRELAHDLGFMHVLDPSSDGNLPQTMHFLTDGVGADILYLCAGVKDSAITNTSLLYCRDRGRVIMIGDMGLDLDRGPLFSKELTLQISRSYGPGRYARAYEEKGMDYPIGYVRWTEQRNLEWYLNALSKELIRVDKMISAEVPLGNAAEAYRRLVEEPDRTLAIILKYSEKSLGIPEPTPLLRCATKVKGAGKLRVGVIGCGAFVQSNLLPLLRELDARLYGVANKTPNAFSALRAVYSPEIMTTSPEELIANDNVDAFVIATRHNLHARLAEAILRHGKPVHVEKPMAMNLEEATVLAKAVRETQGILTVGFNRRFAPAVVALREALASSPRPRQFLYRVNAPAIPADHWSLDPEEGGGRLVGEGCHFIDLLCYLANSEVIGVSGGTLGSSAPLNTAFDNFAMTLRFANGDLGTICYSGQGTPYFSKERIETFAGGHVFVIDNFESFEAYGTSVRGAQAKRKNKGFKGHLENFFAAVRGKSDLTTTAEDGVRVARIIEAFHSGNI